MNYDEERKVREKLQMELDSKDAEIEGCQQKLASIYEGQSISSGNDDGGGGSPLDDTFVSVISSSQVGQRPRECVYVCVRACVRACVYIFSDL